MTCTINYIECVGFNETFVSLRIKLRWKQLRNAVLLASRGDLLLVSSSVQLHKKHYHN